ncbi:amino acid adenylation domain-containing protein [bacterium]|nr:amino acid adenylation domain-containing protein [bacterium]
MSEDRPGKGIDGASRPLDTRQALLQRLRRAAAAPPVAIDRVADRQHPPLSFGQERMWFLEQLEPDSPAYRSQRALRLRGSLEPRLLDATVSLIVQRHDVLRASFASLDGHPTQTIAPEAAVQVPLVDLSGLPSDQREAEALRLGVENGLAPFDLARGPLYHPLLVRLAPDDHILFWAVHHIAFDDWSMGVLLAEFDQAYHALSHGRCPSLSPLPIQYGDYAAWQRRRLQDEDLARQLEHWKQHLAGDLPVLELPIDYPRPAQPSSRGAQESMHLDADVSQALGELGSAHGCTLFMTLLAAYGVLLSRHTGLEDVVIGVPVAGRQMLETEGLLGFFVNTLALRLDLTGTPTFLELMAQVRETCLSAYANQELPFERLVAELQPARTLSRSPVFQAMFQLRNVPRPRVRAEGLRVEQYDYDPGVARFELATSVTPQPSGLSLVANYSTDLFQAHTLHRLCSHFATLLRGVLARPEAGIWDLPIMEEKERHQILVEWNDTAVDFGDKALVVQSFEDQVRRRPEAVALIYEGETVTYADLNRRANRLAHRLQALGVGPEVPVVVLMERCTDLVVALLGVLKAGGVYLPVAPVWPLERLRFLLSDTRAEVIVTVAEHQALASRLHSQVLPLTGDDGLADETDVNPPCRVTRDNLAYLIYTSGSTGRPKGVMISHQAIADHCRAVAHLFPLDESDCILQFMPPTFDPSLEQILGPLTVGARIVLPDTRRWRVSDYLPQIFEHGITHLHITPVFWRQLLEDWAQGPERLTGMPLRRINLGGDVMPPDTLRKWRELPLDHIRLMNACGPTETTIKAMAVYLPPDFGAEGPVLRVPIGRPLANRTMYVLDRRGRPTPIGVPGELYIGGYGLARGYLNQPELTAERFLPNPFSDDPTSRLFRTGDLVRWLPDGNLDILGRLDQQVKVRGFRIELGEVEAALLDPPEVTQAVAAVWGEPGTERTLVGYLVPAPGTSPTVTKLRQSLAQRLPDYMIPSSFVFLKHLPLNSSGKVDREALPPPEQTRPALEVGYEPPRTPVEELVADAFGQVLGLDRVGVHDSFFDLGGHSLAAVRVMLRIRKDIGLELPLRTLFETPTVAGLSRELTRELMAQTEEGELADLLDTVEASEGDPVL